METVTYFNQFSEVRDQRSAGTVPGRPSRLTENCLKIHGKAWNEWITEKLPGTNEIQAFPLDFKYYSSSGRPDGNVPADLCLQLK